MNLSKNVSFQQPFKELNILPVPSQYIISILLFLTKNKDQFMTNSQMHKITTWQTFNLYIPATNLTIYQKGVYYHGIKVYNHLPKTIKDLSGDKNKFKLTLKRHLLHNSSYSLKEYFDTQLVLISHSISLLLWFILNYNTHNY